MKNSKSKAKRLSGVSGKLIQKGGRKNPKALPKIETEAEMTAKSKKIMSNAVKMEKLKSMPKKIKLL